MSLSVGRGVFRNSAAAAMIWPDWQKPHCGTSSAAQARCTGCEELRERPSMVTIRSVGFTSPTRIEQERTTSPLTWTEQAPHCATPHPYLVPVSPTCSRMTHRSGVSSATCTSRFWPLMFNLAIRTLQPRSPSASYSLLFELYDALVSAALPSSETWHTAV